MPSVYVWDLRSAGHFSLRNMWENKLFCNVISPLGHSSLYIHTYVARLRVCLWEVSLTLRGVGLLGQRIDWSHWSGKGILNVMWCQQLDLVHELLVAEHCLDFKGYKRQSFNQWSFFPGDQSFTLVIWSNCSNRNHKSGAGLYPNSLLAIGPWAIHNLLGCVFFCAKKKKRLALESAFSNSRL